ncbi:MAG TPA: hypothetical protein VKH81_13960 [Candidatus Angelobacter sp.]|nr:hypothetical protein [Candidatus Angelobacter sp.]
MFAFRPTLPVSGEDRQWVESGFDRLGRALGHQRLLQARVILPDAEHFPDPYDKSEAAAEKMFRRICDYMQVDHGQIDLEFFPDETSELRKLMPYWSDGNGKSCAGLYFHPDDESRRMVVAMRASNMEDPLTVVATLAHELGHVILLGGGRIDHNAKDMEPLTDLLTVYLGFGIFTANCSGRFRQWHKDGKQGWSMQRLGYLPEEVYGYALARFAHARQERNPKWTRHLSTNLRSYFKKSAAWLEHDERIRKQPIG